MYGGDYNRGKRPYRPLKRRPPTAEEMPDEATAELIREAIRKYPKATAEEVRTFVSVIDHGPEFEVEAIRAVMHFG